MLEGQRILVTGATGQVARPLAEKLNAHNEVIAAARFSDPQAKKELEAIGIGTAHFSMGDEDLSDLPDVDYVFHCGANVDPKTPTSFQPGTLCSLYLSMFFFMNSLYSISFPFSRSKLHSNNIVSPPPRTTFKERI